MLLSGLTVRRVLEIGCNRGHNLVAFSEILGPEVELVGVEPNFSALCLARQSTDQAGFLAGTLYDLRFKRGYFDLVFTCGVLIHVPDEKLPGALLEIHRVTSLSPIDRIFLGTGRRAGLSRRIWALMEAEFSAPRDEGLRRSDCVQPRVPRTGRGL
jgi:ubiquinone/menaquinone biosynthesis C-methylase UbiE